MSFHFQMKGDCSKNDSESLVCYCCTSSSIIYSLYYVMSEGGEDIYEFESLAFSSCMISSTIRSLYYVMGDGGEDIHEFESLTCFSCMILSSINSLYYVMGDGGEYIYEFESLACSMSLYYQMETDCSENNFKWFACFRISITIMSFHF